MQLKYWGNKGFCNRYCGRGLLKFRGVDLHRWVSTRLDCKVQLWILQPDADVCIDWFNSHGFIQAKNAVFILSNGNYDAGNLFVKERKRRLVTILMQKTFIVFLQFFSCILLYKCGNIHYIKIIVL